MSHEDRNAFLAAYRLTYGGTPTEVERRLRDVELAFAEKQNAELLQALDATDGEHLAATAGYRQQIAVMSRIMEAFPEKHMRFGIVREDGAFEEPTACADWCYACTIDRLTERVEELEKQLGTD